MSNVKLITLKTTQTVIGEIVRDTIADYVVKVPVQIIMQPSQNGIGLGFAPFLEFSEEFKTGISFPKDAVLTVTTPVTELLNQYNKVFGSGIQVVSNLPSSL